MKLYKDDVLEAVEREAVKHGGGAVCPCIYTPGKDHSKFDGYMTALARYTDHIRLIDHGAYLDYMTEQNFLTFLHQLSAGDKHAETRYHKDYRKGCRVVKRLLYQLKMEGRVKA